MKIIYKSLRRGADLHKFSPGELYSFRGVTCGTRVWILRLGGRDVLQLTRPETSTRKKSWPLKLQCSIRHPISCLIGLAGAPIIHKIIRQYLSLCEEMRHLHDRLIR